MDKEQKNFDHFEITLWESISSLNNIKDCVETSNENRIDDLMDLQLQLMEVGEWLKRYTTE